MNQKKWRIRRQTTPVQDGQRRWDRAYQKLLEWSQNPLPEQTSARNPQFSGGGVL